MSVKLNKLVKCVACKGTFPIDKCKPIEEKFDGDLHPREVGFDCPLCKHHYTAYVIDDYVVELQKQRDAEHDEFYKGKLQRKINDRMAELKKKYGR